MPSGVVALNSLKSDIGRGPTRHHIVQLPVVQAAGGIARGRLMPVVQPPPELPRQGGVRDGLDIRRIAQIKKGEEVVGGRVRVKVVKNKVAAPFKTTEFDLLYNEGISREGEILALGEKYDIIEKSGSSYKYGETSLGRGYDASRTFLRENKPVANEILKKIREKLAEV